MIICDDNNKFEYNYRILKNNRITFNNNIQGFHLKTKWK